VETRGIDVAAGREERLSFTAFTAAVRVRDGRRALRRSLMAGPGQADAMGRRFLTQRGSVTRYSFMLGQLALSHQADGMTGTMLFDARPPAAAGPP